jgi:hypothetical protein
MAKNYVTILVEWLALPELFAPTDGQNNHLL